MSVNPKELTLSQERRASDAGMVIARYGRIPHAGEHFDWKGWRIEVVDLDGARIDKLLIERALSAVDEPEI